MFITRKIEVDSDIRHDWRYFFYFFVRKSFKKAFNSIFHCDCPISKEYRGIYISLFGINVYWFSDKSPYDKEKNNG